MSHERNVPSKQEVSGAEHTRAGRAYVPDVDICETSDSLWVWAEMPGVDDRSIEVKLTDGVLSIEGQVSLTGYESLSPLCTEYNVGNFARRFTVSNDIDAEHIKARIANGVLEVELPKSARAKPRRIAVTAA